MEQERDFGTAVRRLALPVALQSMLQASFSVVDQLMIGRLGSVSVAGVGLAGTWGVGVPLGALAAFGLGLSIPWVYLLLSLEECVRLALSVKIFRGGRWMNRLKG